MLDESTGKICPRCHTPIGQGDEAAICPDCGAPHHKACFEQAGCGALSCLGRIQPIKSAQAEGRAAFSQDGEAPQQKPSEKRKTCKHCGAALNLGQPYCPCCGANASLSPASADTREEESASPAVDYATYVPPKKINVGAIISILLAVLLVLGSLAGFFIWQSAKQAEEVRIQKIEEERQRRQNVINYLNDSADFCNKSSSVCLALESIGKAIQGEWKSYVYNSYSDYDSVDEAVEAAQKAQAENISVCESQKEEVAALYQKLSALPDGADTKQLKAIQDAAKKYYESYLNFYEHVITPSGNYNDFTSRFAALDREVLENFDSLKKTIEETEVPSLKEEDFGIE